MCIKVETRAKVFRALVRPLQRLPLGFHYFWGDLMSFICEKFLRYRRDVVMVNLARSFPDKKYKELREIAHSFYKHIGEILAEAIWFGGCRNDKGRFSRQRIIEVKDASEIKASFQTAPSVMILDSHFGNWEILGGIIEYLNEAAGEPFFDTDGISVSYKELSNKFWNSFFYHNRLATFPPDFDACKESKQVLRYALANKDKHKIYVFPTDQFPYKGAARHFIPSFMNQPTYVMHGGAALACKMSMAVFCSCMLRDRRGHYTVEYTKICDDASKLSAEEIMLKYYAVLEEAINRAPENYLWSHKRWK